MRDSEKYQKEINIIRSYIKELKTVDKLTLLNGKDYEPISWDLFYFLADRDQIEIGSIDFDKLEETERAYFHKINGVLRLK